jgi:hypothetical protein
MYKPFRTQAYDTRSANNAKWSGSLAGQDAGSDSQKLHDVVAGEAQRENADAAAMRSAGMAAAQHYRNLDIAEQRRKQYDSETQRMAMDKKYSVLGGLMRSAGGGGGYGGFGAPTQSFGFSVDGQGRYSRT